MSTNLSRRPESSPRRRPDWMPDPGVWAFVSEVFRRVWDEDLNKVPETWMALGITGTLDWIMISGWWLFVDTGFYEADDHLNWLHVYERTELTPDDLTVFRYDAEKNGFDERARHPGLSQDEKREVLEFLRDDTFAQFLAAEASVEAFNERDLMMPDRRFLQRIAYATFLWVLSDNGLDWIKSLDSRLAHTHDHRKMYLMQWEDEDAEVLPNKQVKRTARKPGTCRMCEESLWCTRGYTIDRGWAYLCNNCAQELVRLPPEERPEMNLEEPRLRKPGCPKYGGLCPQRSCVYNDAKEDPRLTRMKERGNERLNAYRDRVRVTGMTPRQLAGQQLADMVNYFKEPS